MSESGRKIAVLTDSTSDIPPQETRALDITVIPALLIMEGRTYRDGIDLSREEFYQRLPTVSKPPTTAVPSPAAFKQAFQERLDKGADHLLCIHVASKLSGMVNVVSQAAEGLREKVTLFDSEQVSLGLGFQAMEAAVAAKRGESLASILQTLHDVRQKVRVIAMLDTQEYLHRSGRVSWVTASLGRMLRIRLLVELQHGVVLRRALVRTRSKAVDELMSLAREWGPLKRLAIMHTTSRTDAVELADRLTHLSSTPAFVVDATTLLGVHVGPAALGIAGLVH